MQVAGKSKSKDIMLKITLLVVHVVLFAAVILLMRYTQNLLNSDVKINLMEVVTQNKDVITSKLDLEINNLDSIANRLTDRMENDNNRGAIDLRKTFDNYASENGAENIYVSDLDGNAFFADGSEVNISGRMYFKLAVQEIDNISDRIVSRQTGEDIFVFSVPLYIHGEIIGTIQKCYTPEEMYNLCSISLYSDKGYMYIINREGYILISSKHDEYSREAENYLRILYAQGNHGASRQLQEDIAADKEGFMETKLYGEKTFSAYTPIRNVHEWYLISSVSTGAVSSNANLVIKMFYFILCVVIVILGGNLWGFLSYKNKQQENLRRIAFVDEVTQGNTYNKFVVDLNDTLNKQKDKQYYLLKFDIDNFKYVNNFYGFDVGDKILYQIYHTISDMLHSGETMARISSDNFVVLMDDVGESRLADILGSTKNDEGIRICFSAGIFAISNPEESANLMVDKASAAASVMKGSLQKKVSFYSEEFAEQMIQNEQLKRAVREALDLDQMVPYYQPKVDVYTGKMVGAEALARWITPEGKMIPPDNFIPICEKTGLVTELDMQIFQKVLQFQRKELDNGISCVPISVNFSRLHLLNENFIDTIVTKIEEYKVPPHLIEIELTESVIFDNYEEMSHFISRLHDAGLIVSMDDFGSGYSSLNMLKDITIDVLKIDKGFLDKTLNSSRQLIIFAAIAQMAKQLDIKVVVEGVELSEHVELMKEVGCSIAQGYYFSRPVNEESFDKIYREGIEC